MRILNLGCPRYCSGMTCVDLYPNDDRVIKAEALTFLQFPNDVTPYPVQTEYDEIRSENLLEHLPNVGVFLKLCKTRLAPRGRVVVVTDNAEFLPFYLPFKVPRVGIGAHAVPSYALDFNTVHYCIFSKMHLRLHLQDAGFRDVKVRRILIGARLEGVGYA